ncbi:MAG: LAGLIDADG family homing endonuclease [Candidatus Woesearchaeota archaeon]
MKKLSELQINEIKKLSNIGLSLRSIQNLTNTSLSTIQYHVNRKSDRKRIKQIKLPSSDFVKGELIGAFAGDGSYFHDKSRRGGNHNIRFYLSYRDDKKYVEYLSSILKDMGLSVSLYTTKFMGKPSCLYISTRSVELLKFIQTDLCWEKPKTYSVRLRKDKEHSKDFLCGFARGLMDTDGFVESCSVACGSVSNELIEDLKDILFKIDIVPKITVKRRGGNQKDLYLLRIPSRYLKSYFENIGFSNPRKNKRLIEILDKKKRKAF